MKKKKKKNEEIKIEKNNSKSNCLIKIQK